MELARPNEKPASPSTGTTAPASEGDETISVVSWTEGSPVPRPCECLSIWTWRTCGLPLGGFFLAFLNATAMGVIYGFFLGYMGLESYVLLSITALMKLPQVFLLPLGVMNDCMPVFGYHRKPYFVASFVLCGSSLLALSWRPLPAPYYCQHSDGTYDTASPPCNPDTGPFLKIIFHFRWLYLQRLTGIVILQALQEQPRTSNPRRTGTRFRSSFSSRVCRWAAWPVRVSCCSTLSVSRWNLDHA